MRIHFDKVQHNICILIVIVADIERTYGQRKLLAQRTPLFPARGRKASGDSGNVSHSRQESHDSVVSTDTPAATDGETATDTELETETETEPVVMPSRREKAHKGSSTNSMSAASPAQSQHDLLNQYFRKDAILFHNIDLLRCASFHNIIVDRELNVALFAVLRMLSLC